MLVSIFGAHFCNFWSFLVISSRNSSQSLIFRGNRGTFSKNHKNALQKREVANLHGRAPPLADALGGSARARGAWTRQYRMFSGFW